MPRRDALENSMCLGTIFCHVKAMGIPPPSAMMQWDRALCSLAIAAGFFARLNVPMPFVGFDARGGVHSYRPADALIEDHLSAPLCVDVTIAFPPSDAKNGSPQACSEGRLVTDKAVHKHKQYDALCALHKFDFTTFALDVSGVAHHDTMALMNRLATAYDRKNACAFGYAFSIVTRRISFALQREIANLSKQRCSTTCGVTLQPSLCSIYLVWFTVRR